MMHFILRFSSSMLSNTLAFQREMSLKDQNQALLQVAKTLFTSLGVCGAWCVCVWVGGWACIGQNCLQHSTLFCSLPLFKDDSQVLLHAVMEEARNLIKAERCCVYTHLVYHTCFYTHTWFIPHLINHTGVRCSLLTRRLKSWLLQCLIAAYQDAVRYSSSFSSFSSLYYILSSLSSHLSFLHLYSLIWIIYYHITHFPQGMQETFRIPIGQGIAGYVAESGELMETQWQTLR